MLPHSLVRFMISLRLIDQKNRGHLPTSKSYWILDMWSYMTWRSSVRLIWKPRAMILYLLNLPSLIARMMILPRLSKTLYFSMNTAVLHWSQRNSSKSSNTNLSTPRLKSIYYANTPIILPSYIFLQVRFKKRMAVSLILSQHLDWMWNYPSSDGASLIPPLGIWSSVISPIKQNDKGQRKRRQIGSSASLLGTPTAIQ